ncbi:hypothetical protein F5Y00DRAFT_121168 [Daldinia vernicosa]|uniref:uncharacterized protein n=1 Tax=Daldinia vernicosa TaxID=114800 RepID=UPI002008D850|nr:uncharacterized protein F5Y00DRAFT_121168 [Daldinia vernicosa]KAI0847337.1 hypothetical protein F5Y00DRAFT_121168 [Daldinia vernicosa]
MIFFFFFPLAISLVAFQYGSFYSCCARVGVAIYQWLYIGLNSLGLYLKTHFSYSRSSRLVLSLCNSNTPLFAGNEAI